MGNFYQRPKHIHPDSIDMLDYCNASSAGDCTGLIPSLPQSEDELDSYKDILNYAPQKD